MADYIDREKIFSIWRSMPAPASVTSLAAAISQTPAADVVEVRRGRWVDENKNPVPWDECNSKCPSHSAYCSECGEWLTASDEYPVTGLYCPNCGALMDGKEDEHEAG